MRSDQVVDKASHWRALGPWATKVPRPCWRSKSPSASSIDTAWRTVISETPNSCASASSEGSRSPDVRCPDRICRRRRSHTIA